MIYENGSAKDYEPTGRKVSSFGHSIIVFG